MLPEVVLGLFVAVCLVGMYFWLGWEALPFHFAYVSVAVFYGIRLWRVPHALLAILLVSGATLALTTASVVRGSEAAEELVEVPLMSLMFVAMVWHVEVRRRAERALARAVERERRFVVNASHDLMTPLTIARGYAEVLGVDGPPQEDELAETRGVIIDELDRMEALLTDLLLVGRMERREAFGGAAVDVDDLVTRLVRRWAGFGDRVWDVDTNAAGTVTGDLKALERAIDNVLENARTHTYQGDAIHVRTSTSGSVARISVEDEGAGIASDAIEHVFDRFYRAGTERGRRTGRAGLGLAIVREVARAHGGDVEISSREGDGTRVTITIPGFVTRSEGVAFAAG